VSVSAKLTSAGGTHALAFHFVIARADTHLYNPPAHVAPVPGRAHVAAVPRQAHATVSGEVQRYRSRPDLKPPALVVTARSPQTAPGELFSTPYSGPGQSGPMIFDEAGNVVWFDPLAGGADASNLQVQQLDGRPVLSWWQGNITPQGFGAGEEVLLDSAYEQVGRVYAGNGFKADLHEFRIAARDTAVLTVYNPINCDLSSVGGPRAGAATDSIIQELDLRTGLVRSEWHSLDHVPLGDSYSSAHTTSAEWPFDFFHINSIERLAAGNTLISARNTSALYELNTLSGQVLLRVGGRRSSVKLTAGAATAFQHDATVLENGTISVFDNGATPKVHSQSRGLVLAVNPQTKTDAVLAQFEHPAPLSSGSQGNIQQLAGGDMFVGWGSEPYFSEFSATGALLFDGHMQGSYQSYRTYRFPWTGAPTGAPTVAALAGGGRSPLAGAPVTVYASWNGATQVASWRVLAGPTPTRLAPAATASRAGFETTIAIPGPVAYVAVQALEASGAVLGTSATIKG
jgi:hypothetical protein